MGATRFELITSHWKGKKIKESDMQKYILNYFIKLLMDKTLKKLIINPQKYRPKKKFLKSRK